MIHRIKFLKTLNYLLLIITLSPFFSLAQLPFWESANQYGIITSELTQKVKVDKLGNRYFIGMFQDSTYLGSPLVSDAVITDMFVAKSDSNGNILWSLNAGSMFTTTATDLAIDKSGNCYITGYFRWNAHFGSFSHYDTTYQKARVLFLTKIDSLGNVVWSLSENDVKSAGTCLAVDSLDNIYLSGFYSSTPFNASSSPLSFSFAGLTAPPTNTPWSHNLFTIKLNTAGQGEWIHYIETDGETDFYFNTYHPTGKSMELGNSIRTDNLGNVYVAASYIADTLTSGNYSFNFPNGSDSIFKVALIKYDNYGTVQWMENFYGSNDITAMAMTLDESNNVIVTGLFKGTATIDGNIINSQGGTDTYIAKFLNSGLVDWIYTLNGINNTDIVFSSEVVSDESNYIYIGGWWTGNISIDNSNYSAPNIRSAYILKLTPNGQFSWVDTTERSIITGLDISSDGRLYVALTFNDYIQLDSYSFVSNGDNDILIGVLSSTVITDIIPNSVTTFQFKLFPNPSNDLINLEFDQIKGDTEINLFDTYGRIVFKKKILVNSEKRFMIDISKLKSGLYYLKVTNGKSDRTKKLWKE